jgi:oxygen-dependent protoporphyrinogen oxidase
VRDIFACAGHRATAELGELAAGAGIGLFALVWAGKGSLIARNLRGGTGRLPAAIGHELGERARTGSPVDAVRPDGAELLVSCAGEEIRARHVIMAAQAPHAAPLVAPVAERAADALSRLTYGAFLSVAVETDETGPMPYDGVYAIATPGRVFDMFTNQAHAVRSGPRRAGGSLMLFAGARAAALMRESDETIVERFLADLYELYPQARGVVAAARVKRWELGNVYASPGRGRLQPALEGALGAHENLHLAGDYFAELGTMEAAAQTGLAAAERVETRIREVAHV